MKRKRNDIIIYFFLLTVLSSCKEIKSKDTNNQYITKVDTLFYKNGKIWTLTPRLENWQRNGRSYRFYENGKIEYKIDYFRDKKVNEEIWYFNNGKLNFYTKRNKKEIPFFIIQFDSLGNLKNKLGSIINTEYDIKGGNETLKINNKKILRFQYANPEFYNFNLDSIILDRNYKLKIKPTYNNKNQIYFDYIPKDYGPQKIILYSSLKNKKGKTIISDVFEKDLYVK